ncbi:coiled-coil domain-containing protein 191-like [Asterias rubens]|uniref:coiled-coil domain-containing protein 191-like n=1 Tax=Asterias rubens TaxID=7604 RepID=UPI00145594D1|nr:coiled-coil domain-containing protein 191-like [Asterias rubens]
MASRNPDLYRWKRWSKETPSSTSTSTHLNTSKKKSQRPATDDIQGWIKKVEKASDRAAALTFGPRPSHHGDYSAANGYRGAAATLEAVHDHDEAHSEAQDLLNQWMAQKCGLDDDGEDDLKYFEDDDIQDYVASKEAEKSDLRSQWNDMLAENDPVAMDPYSQVTSEELFHEIETRDDSLAVQSIIDGLLKKDIVKTKFKKDLGLEGETVKKRDPRTTMAARQLKVKENREKRQQTRESKLRQQQQHKDAQSQAHQIVMKEERTKEMQRQREEALVQQEMARLRKEMQEQRLQEEAARQREREREARQKEDQRKEEAKRRQEELQSRLEADSMIEDERREMRKRLEELRAVKAAQDLKCLQRHFHAWYQTVMTKRLALGKARAVCDWRTLLRAWNAWRAFVRASQADRETREIEQSFKDVHRKNQMAIVHNRKRILKKYLLDWKLWLQNEHLSKDLEQQQNKTKSKMAAFLEAAASGKLWTNREEEEEAYRDKSGRKETSDRPDSVAQKVDDIFGVQRQPSGNITSGGSSARSDTSSVSSTPKSKRHHTSAGPTKPKHAWQVTRKHVNLPIEEMLTVGDEDAEQPNRNQNNAISDKDSESGVNSATGGKRNINYKTNSFEHRYAAQQRILHEQQYQLREQKRLIEDLQTAQRQQLLKMQIGVPAKDGSLEVVDIPDSLLSTERTQPEVDTPSSTARSDHSDSSSVSDQSKNKQTSRPQLLKGMKEREESRLKMKAEREERHRKKEQEKLAEIKAKEEKQREEDEAEKRAKIEKRKEEKRLIKQREFEKQERLALLNQQTVRADEHYRRSLLQNKGLNPWLRLVKSARQNMQVSEDHHSTVLLRKCMFPWRQHAEEVMQEKFMMASKQYELILIRGAMNSWKRYGHLQSLQLQKARRHYIHNLKMRVLQAWQEHITNEKLRMWKNEEVAEEHNETRILKPAFVGWRQYPKMLKAERLREKRLEDIRKKVSSILPDFGVS